MMRRTHRPWLLCLDMRKEHLARRFADPMYRDCIANIASLLETARSSSWDITHVYGRTEPTAHASPRLVDVSSEQDITDYGSIDALEPLSDEPVFFRHKLSALWSASLREQAARSHTLYLAGSIFSPSGLATILHAFELGAAPTIIEDACFPLTEELSEQATMVRLTRSSFSALARFETKEAVLQRMDNKVVALHSAPQYVRS